MANDMMIAALNAQRSGKMAMPQAPSGPDKSGGDLAARLAELEQKYDKLCDYVGMPKEGDKEEVKEPSEKPAGAY